jgi:hypothetical protein
MYENDWASALFPLAFLEHQVAVLGFALRGS